MLRRRRIIAKPSRYYFSLVKELKVFYSIFLKRDDISSDTYSYIYFIVFFIMGFEEGIKRIIKDIREIYSAQEF